MPTVLVTRPELDAAPLRRALSEIGVDCVMAPMLGIRYEDGPILDLQGFQGILFTSANGVRALAARTDIRAIPVFAVGDATARAAADLGFATVDSAAGDVDALSERVTAMCQPNAGPLYHAAGSVTAGDIAGRLRSVGFEVVREQLYTAEPATALTEAAGDALRHGNVDGVVVFSPRTMRTLETVLATDGVDDFAKRLTLFALSENVSNAAQLLWRRRFVAATPDQQALLDTVRSCYY